MCTNPTYVYFVPLWLNQTFFGTTELIQLEPFHHYDISHLFVAIVDFCQTHFVFLTYLVQSGTGTLNVPSHLLYCIKGVEVEPAASLFKSTVKCISLL